MNDNDTTTLAMVNKYFYFKMFIMLQVGILSKYD